MHLVLGIFGKQLIVKLFMHRTLPKRCVLLVFWTAQYISEVYFTWGRLLLTLWHLFMGITPLGVFLFYSHSKTKQKKCLFTNSSILEICSWMVFLLICAKKPRNGDFDVNFIFSLSYKISFADLTSLLMECITYTITRFIVRLRNHGKR